MSDNQLIETYVRLIVERQVKQAHLSGDRTSEWGSEDHISDLELRCADAAYWRDKYPKGSERRGHYRNVYNTLKRELQSAKKKSQLNEMQKKSTSRVARHRLHEGGLVGHLMHLYDNRELTFGEIKKILRKAAAGRLEKVSEKMDGMNLVFSYDVSVGQLKVTRGSEIKGGGMDASALASKFAGRGSVEEAFTKAFKVVEGAVGALPRKVQQQVFGPSANRWYSMEIVYTKNPNVINYDSDNVVFHGWPVFKRGRSGEVQMSEDDVGGVDILSRYIDRMQAAVSESGWRVRGPSIVRMKKLSDGSIYSSAIAAIDAAMTQAGTKDGDTIDAYLRGLLQEEVATMSLPDDVADMVMSRVMEDPGAPTVVDIKKNSDKSYHGIISSFVKNSPALFKKFISPIELAINDFAVELLKGLESTLIDDTGKEVQRLRAEVGTAISAIETSGNETAMTTLAAQMAKLKSVENITSPMEGVVFIYKGNAYKFTGSFAAANQILGMFKYGRGGFKPQSKS